MTDMNGNLDLLRLRDLCSREPCFRELCFREIPAVGVKPYGPGIYEWWLDWMGKHSVYVGQSGDLSRRIEDYRRDVRRLLRGSPYNRRKPKDD
jgi:hypothetical protein